MHRTIFKSFFTTLHKTTYTCEYHQNLTKLFLSNREQDQSQKHIHLSGTDMDPCNNMDQPTIIR